MAGGSNPDGPRRRDTYELAHPNDKKPARIPQSKANTAPRPDGFDELSSDKKLAVANRGNGLLATALAEYSTIKTRLAGMPADQRRINEAHMATVARRIRQHGGQVPA